MREKKLIVHIAGISLNKTGGMARISSSWKDAFERAGYEFLHLGPAEIKPKKHHSLFGKEAREYLLQQRIKPDLILAHEPTSGYLKFKGIPLVIFSHGIEERAWNLNRVQHFFPTGLKSKLLPDFIRFKSHRRGFKTADLILLSNYTDKAYLKARGIDRTEVFTNGYNRYEIDGIRSELTFLYNASWIERKGTRLLEDAFNSVLQFYPECRLILAGTGAKEEEVLRNFNRQVRPQITVISSFSEEEEANLYKNALFFVLPSYFEGQSLALTQAMAMGLCPVVSDNCGQIDLVEDGVNGFVFTTGSSSSLRQKLELAISNTSKSKLFGDISANKVANRSWEKVGDEVVNWCIQLFRKNLER